MEDICRRWYYKVISVLRNWLFCLSKLLSSKISDITLRCGNFLDYMQMYNPHLSRLSKLAYKWRGNYENHPQSHSRFYSSFLQSSDLRSTVSCDKPQQIILNCSTSFHLEIRLSICQAEVLLRTSPVLRSRETQETTQGYDFSYGRRYVTGDTIC